MVTEYWLRQGSAEPLFGDLLWSRPETKAARGKLLIIGGNSHVMTAPAKAYAAAAKAGAGSIRILLPEGLRKTVAPILPEAEFAHSTPSGSFNRQALDQWLDLASWADGVLLAGDFGRNSETAILLESFLGKHHGQVTLAGDSLDYFWGPQSAITARANTAAVINFGKLQKLAQNNQPVAAIKHAMLLQKLVDSLHDWTDEQPVSILTKHADQLVCASGGQVSTTPFTGELDWQLELAAYAAVWWLQQPSKTFQALTSAIYEYQATANTRNGAIS